MALAKALSYVFYQAIAIIILDMFSKKARLRVSTDFEVITELINNQI